MTISIKPVGVQRYKHTQATASAEWVIQHNLNKAMVACDTYINNSLVLPKAIDILDNNTIKVTWSSPKAGYATIC